MITYPNGKELGSHELHLKKLSQAALLRPYRVTFVSSSDIPATVQVDNEKIILKSGMLIYENQLIETNSSRVELRSKAAMYRLERNSEFCIENTAEGMLPVYYGHVYVKPSPFYDNGKYRTSCYMPDPSTDVLIMNVDDSEDVYYSLENEVKISEYDEEGRMFTITQMSPFTKLVLSFDATQMMRNKYKVSHTSSLTDKDIDEIYDLFIKPNRWR